MRRRLNYRRYGVALGVGGVLIAGLYVFQSVMRNKAFEWLAQNRELTREDRLLLFLASIVSDYLVLLGLLVLALSLVVAWFFEPPEFD